MPRSSSRSTAWLKVACESENATWCTQPGIDRGAGRVGRALLVGEDGDQAAVTGVEVEVALRSIVEVRLLEDERHAEHAFPEVDRRLAVGAGDGDVVHALALKLPHSVSSCLRLFSVDQLGLVLAALQRPPRHQLDPRLHDQHAAQPVADRRRQRRVGGHVAGHLDRHRQRRLLLHPGRRRRDHDVAADLWRELTDHLAHGRREHVHATHDQHVVGAADAAHPRPGAAARAGAGAHRDVVARAESQQRSGLVGEVRQHQLAAGAVVHRNGRPRLRVDQLRMDETARAQVHAVLPLALAPQRHAQVADAHRLGHPRPPAPLQHLAEGRLAAARLARDQHPPHALGGQVDAAIGRPLDQVGGVGRRQHRRLRPQQLDRQHQALAVAGADRDVGEADAIERGQRCTGHERPGVVGRHDSLAGGDAGRGVAPGRPGHPVVKIGNGQRDVAGSAGGTAGGVDAYDLLPLDAEVRADRVGGGDARPQLLLFGQRQPRDVGQAARLPGLGDPCRRQLLAVEGRPLEQIGQLRPVGDVVQLQLLVPRARLDLGIEQRHGASGGR